MVARISPKILWSQRLDEGHPHIQPKKILIADDNQEVLESVSRLVGRSLKLPEQDLILASNFESACRCFNLHAPEIRAIITDMEMSGPDDGLRLYRYVRERGSYPLAVFSGGIKVSFEKELRAIVDQDTSCRYYEKPDFPGLIAWIRSIHNL